MMCVMADLRKLHPTDRTFDVLFIIRTGFCLRNTTFDSQHSETGRLLDSIAMGSSLSNSITNCFMNDSRTCNKFVNETI